MEVIKRKISLEDIRKRTKDGYGQLEGNYVYINIHLQQSMDDMGVFTDADFIESPTEEVDKNLILEGYRPNFQKKAWYKAGDKLTATTDSKLEDLRGYKAKNRFKVGFDIKKETYINYKGEEVIGVSRVIDNGDTPTYVMDTRNNNVIGTEDQTTGLLYKDLPNDTTQVQYKAEGVNETNSSISANTKEEYLMGIISNPEIESDVFINRGEMSITEPHLRLSEIENLGHLERYGNGYFNVK